MAEVFVLEVRLHGRPIGTLTRLPGDRTLFAFSEAYIEDPQRPTLGLSFRDAFGGLITDVRPTQTRLMPYFANLLPEGRLRDYLAARAGVSPRREFFLLWALGRDLPGAVTVAPAEGKAWPPGGEADLPADDDRRDGPLRFSLAGVQLKFSAVAAARGGLTIPARGVGGSWIVKLPSAQYEAVPENEFSMMHLAARIGMDVPELRLVALDDIGGLPPGIGEALTGPALAIRRFDRTPDCGPVHMEDFAQVFGVYPERKYEKASYRTIADVLWRETGETGLAEFIRRLVFNTLIGNGDMHLKNWSVLYPDRRTAALAPAYDFVSTIPYIPGDRAALKYVRTRRMDEVSEAELVRLAGRARLPEALVLATARETVARFHEAWHAEHRHLPLPRAHAAAIEAHAKRVPLAAIRGGG